MDFSVPPNFFALSMVFVGPQTRFTVNHFAISHNFIDINPLTKIATIIKKLLFLKKIISFSATIFTTSSNQTTPAYQNVTLFLTAFRLTLGSFLVSFLKRDNRYEVRYLLF